MTKAKKPQPVPRPAKSPERAAWEAAQLRKAAECLALFRAQGKAADPETPRKKRGQP